MKKVLMGLLIPLLLLCGVFLWKGGHHALFLCYVVDEWLDADRADQTVSVNVGDVSLSGDLYWMEQGDDTVYALQSGGVAVYLREDVLYLDTGAAYSIPDLSPLKQELRRILMGAVLYGRITKQNGVYDFAMETGDLDLTAQIRADHAIREISINGTLRKDGKTLPFSGSMISDAPQTHALPQAVVDGMVRAAFQRPTPITAPLGVLIPVLENLLPMRADVKLGVDCGILTLSQTAVLELDADHAVLSRDGAQIRLTLPQQLRQLDPLTMGLLLLRSGTFIQNGDEATFRSEIPGELMADLAEQLVPQAADLGITFDSGTVDLMIHSGALTCVCLQAQGNVPFLTTEIPLGFTAEFRIS